MLGGYVPSGLGRDGVRPGPGRRAHGVEEATIQSIMGGGGGGAPQRQPRSTPNLPGPGRIHTWSGKRIVRGRCGAGTRATAAAAHHSVRGSRFKGVPSHFFRSRCGRLVMSKRLLPVHLSQTGLNGPRAQLPAIVAAAAVAVGPPLCWAGGAMRVRWVATVGQKVQVAAITAGQRLPHAAARTTATTQHSSDENQVGDGRPWSRVGLWGGASAGAGGRRHRTRRW